ncbi:TetR/AcrR family transcriptional regulator [Prescottella sp. R16]|uniref:TetR/AcrR family transcriptional regulator n=1 Tax=Prescottella sp. R16 TaxID=3064529 RepID=UPI00272EB3B0|nr:TetR family transcriptional regulator [Prescottella sp. R16]
MPRKATHTAESLLDAAARIAATEGAAAVSMSAVAAAAQAPSGSVYYRFPDRAALLSALWLRTVDRFHHGFLEALAGTPADRAAVQAARHVVEWSRDNPVDATVLLAGRSAFGYTYWSDDARSAEAARQHRLSTELDALSTRLGYRGRADRERLVLLLVDLPSAALRRQLSGTGTVSDTTVDAVELIVRRALA